MIDLGSLIIRPTTETDLDSLVACVNAVFVERRYLAITEPIPFDEARAYHASQLSAGHPHFSVLDDDTVVGCCDIVPLAPVRIGGQQHIGNLGMFLAPAYRNLGIGERLLRATLTAAKTRWPIIELAVYSHNERARKLYQRCGFIEDGRRVGAWRLDGEVSDIIHMSLSAQHIS
jgi:RimJ/RimL family protein N-acetyltransferase